MSRVVGSKSCITHFQINMQFLEFHSAFMLINNIAIDTKILLYILVVIIGFEMFWIVEIHEN